MKCKIKEKLQQHLSYIRRLVAGVDLTAEDRTGSESPANLVRAIFA